MEEGNSPGDEKCDDCFEFYEGNMENLPTGYQ